jgi:UPF0271 protein
VEGQWVGMQVDTICLHGDTPQAAARAQHLASGMRGEGIVIRSPLSRMH